MMHWLDHLLTAIFVVLFPLYAWFETRRTKAKLRSDPDGVALDIVTEYKRTIATLTALAALCLVVWFALGRQAAALGLGYESTILRWAGGAAIALAGIVFAQMQASKLKSDDGARAELKAQFGELTFFLPKTARELSWFNRVAFTAGVCEEIIYRGFLIWYLATWIGSIPALFASSIAFGVAHSYQGAANGARAGVVGLWMGTIYLVSGTLWIPMLAHFVYDVISGRIIYSLTSEANGESYAEARG